MGKRRVLWIVALCFVLFSALSMVSFGAAEHEAIFDKIRQANVEIVTDFATRGSFLIAFFAGMLGILSPCILPFLPAYFSYTFKEKKDITLMTLVFFIGFSLTFVTMGVVAGLLGDRAFNAVQPDVLVRVVGTLIIGMGLLSLTGKGFSSFISQDRKFSHDIPGTILFGIFFALGWSACLGPILTSILGIGALLANPLTAGFLLFFYSLGNLVPLFVLAVFYDKLDFGNSSFVKGWMLTFNIFGREVNVHSTNLISGILFIVLGAIMVIFAGTTIFNTAWLSSSFDNVQRSLLDIPNIGLYSLVALIVFVFAIGYVLYSQYGKKSRVVKKEEKKGDAK